MLLNLYISNFAIIDKIDISFEKGLNIISGETGSGKSLLLKALSLLKGERFSKDYMGKFTDKTIVEAIFTGNDSINSILSENGFDIDDNIIISRQFTDTSSITKINNRACNIKFLTSISNQLFDIHGQHSSLIVLNKSNYIDMLDNFSDGTASLRKNLSENMKKINIAYEKLNELDLEPEEIEREKDLLLYQINEIEDFNFDEYDEEKLNKEYKKLTNQKELIEGTNRIINFLNEGQRIPSFKEFASILYDKIVDLENLDEDLKELSSDSLNIKELINELSEKIERYSYSLNIDEERIEILEDLFSSFQVLKLKYGRTEEEILGFLQNSKSRLKLISNIDNKRIELEKEIKNLNKENLDIATKLHEIRVYIAKELEKKIIHELEEMNMQYIDFKIVFKHNEKVNKDGFDDIDFLISTNKGQELKSLSQVSSGGEISRFMLAMKAVLSEKEEIDTIIFDEIDTGISGKTANIVGDKLKKISKNLQLIVISHLAQIASKSDAHFLLTKSSTGENTISKIKKLDYDEKIREIARLISGSDITDLSMKTSEQLLEENYGK